VNLVNEKPYTNVWFGTTFQNEIDVKADIAFFQTSSDG
jgi:hypothetical protein